MKKLAALLLAMVVACSALTSCGGDTKPASSTTPSGSTPASSATTPAGSEDERITEIKLPLSEEKKEFSKWRVWSSNYLTDYEEIAAVQELEKRTNIHINYTTVPDSAAQEKYGLMLASGNYPDMIFDAGMASTSYPGGDEKGVDDGVLRDLTPYVDKYMPNYRSIIESNEDVMHCVVTDSGMNIGAYMIRSYVDGHNQQAVVACEPCWCGPAIRRDWLEELNLEAPVTIDDLHNVLVAFKDNYNATMDIFNDGIIGYDFILSAYGVTSDFYQENGQVKFGPTTEAYKKYVTLMRDWYNEGLINRDFVSNNGWYLRVDDSLFANGTVGYGVTVHGFLGKYYLEQGMTDNENFYLEPLIAPVMNKGDKVNVMYQSVIAVQPLYVTTSVSDEDMPILSQWIDYHYTYDCLVLDCFGIEDLTYTVDENSEWYYVYTDMVKYPEGGISINDLLGQYTTNYTVGLMNWKSGWQNWELTGNDWSQKGYETWANQTDSIMLPLNIAFTAEEAAEYSLLFVDIESFIKESTVKFIIGDKDIDAEWDSYVATIEGMDIAKCIALKQASLDRYNAKTWLLAK